MKAILKKIRAAISKEAMRKLFSKKSRL